MLTVRLTAITLVALVADAEASGVVDDDHVRSTLLDELGGNAGSGTGNDDISNTSGPPNPFIVIAFMG